MPRDGSQVYSTPPGTDAVSGTSISSSAFNQLVADLAADLNTPRPISAGGTGATSPETALEALGAAPANSRLVPWDAGDIKPTRRKTAASGWLFCFGQAVLRSSYADLDTAIYVGDTLNATAPDGYRTTSATAPSTNRSISGQYIVLPDYRGRTLAGRDNMGGTSADRLTGQSGGIDGDTLGATGGAETHTLTTAQIASHSHTGTTNSAGDHTHTATTKISGSDGGNYLARVDNASSIATLTNMIGSAGAHTHTMSINNSGGGGAHNNVQPTAIINFVIKT